MSIDSIVFAFAGAVILASIALALLVDLRWLFLTGLVGVNLLQSTFTGFCPLALILKRFGVKSGCAF
jgi:hypothetical protein